MSPEQQRIKIAEACGFDKSHWLELGSGIVFGTSAIVPDYLNDLNAMHEAEKVLTEDQWGPYCIMLNQLACRIQCKNTHTCGYTLAATAAQRAEAFLRTLNLWEE